MSEEGKVHDRGDVSPDPAKVAVAMPAARPKQQTDFGITKIPQQQFMKVLLYGDSGVGKTRLSATADDCEEMRPVLYCDSDVGIMTISHRTELDYKKLESLDDAFDVLRLVRLHPARYRTVILDGLMSLYTRVMADRLRLAKDKPGHDAYVPVMQDWLHCQFRMRALLSAFRDQPINFVATTCAALERTGEEEGVVTIVPDLPGKLADQVGQMFDIVGYLYVRAVGRKITRMLQIQPFHRVIAKNRSPYSDVMGPIIEEPTMSAMYHAALLGDTAAVHPQTADKSSRMRATDESETDKGE